MRVPSDRTLREWVLDLSREGSLYRFYKTREWLELRERVMAENHGECARCRDKIPSVLRRADTVHHVNEVKTHPELALSMYFTDSEGVSKPNLIPLCNRCHNEVHGRFAGAEKKPLPSFFVERW